MKLSKSLRSAAAALVMLGGSTVVVLAIHGGAYAAVESVDEPHVVYHVDEEASMRDALNNISSQIAQSPNAHITLLANGRGVVVLAKGEGDRQGDYAETISALQAKGVKFVACATAMKKNNLPESSLLPNVSTVPSGVVELTRLQTVEHYAYIKP
jgi:uncharacterized protein